MSSFYGSNLWDFNSESAVKLYSSWNRMIQTAYNLPFGTHRFILKELSERPPLQAVLHKRFERFCEQIKNSGRPEVLHLFKKQCYDSRSIFGRNYRSVVPDSRKLGAGEQCSREFLGGKAPKQRNLSQMIFKIYIWEDFLYSTEPSEKTEKALITFFNLLWFI